MTKDVNVTEALKERGVNYTTNFDSGSGTENARFSILATFLASPLSESLFEIRMDRETDTEQSGRILVLWLDLHEAMDAIKRAGPVITEITPWDCSVGSVRAV